MHTSNLPPEIKTDKFAARLYRGITFNASCWLLNQNLDDDGYAYIKVGKKRIRAHRASYFLHKGEIPYGLLVCHKCDTPNCINPLHLFLGTIRDNTVDASLKGRLSSGLNNGLSIFHAKIKNGSLPQQSPHPSPGENNGSAKLTAKDVSLIRKQHALKIETYSTLATKFKVSKGCIASIVKRRTWNHLPTPN